MSLLKKTLAVVTLASAAIALASCSLLPGAGGDNTSAPSGDGATVDVFTVAPGTCVNDTGQTGTISETNVIDCAQPHDSEAFASIIMDDGDFPGQQAVKDKAVADCTTEFTAWMGIDYQASKYDFAYYYPTESSWASGDREILCLAYDPAGQTTGSLKGLAQ